MLTTSSARKAHRIKSMYDLIACELCSVSVAIIIDCLLFYGYFTYSATPWIIIALLAVSCVAVLAIRKSFMERVWVKECPEMALIQNGLGARATNAIGNGAIYFVLIAITLIWLFPFVGIVLDSFEVSYPGMDQYLIPREWGFDNYVKLFEKTDFLKWFLNTAIMGVFTAILQTFFVLSMSYTLSRLRFKGRKGLMNMMLILGMFPGFLTLILIYKVFSDIGLTMQMAPVGLVIVYCASSGMGYYVSKGFFDTISKSLDEAARIDGATRFQVFYKIIMPLSKPIVIYTVLMGFMAPWGDFMMANYLIHQNSQGMNVAVGMFEWLSRTNVNTHYTMFCAAGVCVAIPVTAVFLALQKYYVEGVTGGAVKG